MRTNHKEYGIPYNFNLFEDYYVYPLKMNWELRTEKQAEKYFKKLSKTLGSDYKLNYYVGETYDTLKDFMNTSKRVIKDMPNNQALFEELNDYINHYRKMEQKNRHLQVEIRRLENKNEELQTENRMLHNFLNVMLQTIKKFFNKLLHIGSEKDKDNVVEEITSYHGLGYYNDRDLHDIADDTPREEEINSYIYEQKYGIDKDYDDRDIDI